MVGTLNLIFACCNLLQGETFDCPEQVPFRLTHNIVNAMVSGTRENNNHLGWERGEGSRQQFKCFSQLLSSGRLKNPHCSILHVFWGKNLKQTLIYTGNDLNLDLHVTLFVECSKPSKSRFTQQENIFFGKEKVTSNCKNQDLDGLKGTVLLHV